MATVTKTTCPKCRKTLTADHDIAGRRIECPACQSSFVVPATEAPVIDTTPKPSPPAIPSRIDEKMSWDDLKRGSPWLVFGIAALTFLVTLRGYNSAPIHYLALIVATGWITTIVLRRYFPHAPWVTGVAIAAAIGTAFVWGQFDYSIQEWTAPKDEEFEEVRYTDYVKRGHSKPFWRVINFTENDGHSWTDKGAMTESGKLHGMWHRFDTRGPVENWSTDRWYWYGEPVSEGEWHLRNK
jgi:hypothetical protein